MIQHAQSNRPAPGADAPVRDEASLFAPVYPLPRLEIASGRGARVTDTAGREYIDFVSGIAVNALGHAPAGLRRVVAEQMKSLVHTSNLYVSAPALALGRALAAATGYDRVFFCNSGSEGNEAAIKFARSRAHALKRPGRGLVAFKGSFHGRTGFAVSTTWTPAYREPFEPLIPGVVFGEFNDVAALASLITPDVAAVIVEPVQGESGAVPATRAFLSALRERTTAAGAMLIFDEVQIGMGRSGTLLAAEQFGVRPDMVVLSKALAGGLPLGAVLTTEAAAAHLTPGMHGTTFGGGPVTTAAAGYVLTTINQPAFLAGVRRRARKLNRALKGLVTRHRILKETRGLGLLQAVELSADTRLVPADLVNAAREEGLLLVRGGSRAVRILPPLNVKPTEIDEAMARLDRALTRLEAKETSS